MSEASKIGFSVEIPSELVDRANLVSKSKTYAAINSRSSRREITLESTIAWIERQNFPSDSEVNLIKQARNCPSGALRHFKCNIKKWKK